MMNVNLVPLIMIKNSFYVYVNNVCFGFCYDTESDRWGLQEEEERKA
jgi:hypothetical protein